MSKTMFIQFLKAAICAFSLLIGIVCGQSSPEQAQSSGLVLPLIEKYKAPPFPRQQYTDRDTYDYRIASRSPVPPTLTDALIYDIWQRLELDLKLKVEPKQVSEETIKQAMGIYLSRGWRDIAGYRPWAHWNFIRGLKPPQRELLVKEIVAYITTNGIKDVD